jgi:hypothetical protein
MAINRGKRISELTPLTSASLDTTIVGVDNGTTYKIELDVLADAVTARVNTLDRDRLQSLESVTSSFETKGRSVVSGSSQLTSSFDQRYVASGSITQTTWDNIANKPAGIVSQSTDLSSLNTFTASISTASLVNRLNTIESVSGSWITESETGSFLTNLNGAISSSSQLTSSFDVRYTLSGSVQNIELPSNLVSGSSQLTSSLDGRYLQSGSSPSSDSITFNRTAGINVTEGQMAWNNSDGTLDIGLNYGDVVLQVGQEQHYVVRNSTGTTIPNGTAVYASAVSVGSKRIEVSPFTADGTGDEVRFLGLATHNISDGVNGVVSNFGYVRGLDTRGTSTTAISVGDETWAEGDILYAHPTAAGKLTKVAPKNKITVAMVTTRHQTTGVLFVRPSSFGHIDDLHDVQINTGSLVTGSMLEWNGGYFVNNNTFSSSVDTRLDTLENATSSYLTSLSGAISSSSQLTSSFDTRYVASGSISAVPAGTISGSAQITTLGFISSSTTINTGSFATTGSNSFIGNQNITGSLVVSAVAVVNGGITVPTGSILSLTTGSSISVDSSGAITGSLTGSVFGIGDVVAFSASLNSRIISGSSVAGTISGSSQLTSSYDSRYSLSGSVLTSFSSSVDTRLDTLEASIITGSANYVQVLGNKRTGINTVNTSIISGSITTTGNPVQIMVTGDANPITTAWARLQIYRDGSAIGAIVQVENSSNLNVPYCVNVIDTPSAGTYVYSMRLVDSMSGTFDFGEASGPLLTAVELKSQTSFQGITLISGSSQLTSSYDTRYTLSGSISATPAGTISGSSQLTSSYDTRYTLSGSVVSGTTPAGTISGSSQLTSSYDGRYTQTGSFNTLTASFNSFTASAQSVTTGSNSFNGTQTITGSLIITTGSFVASQIVANTASLYLTSGSNLYVQNNGIVEITGSMTITGETIFSGSVKIGPGGGSEGGEIALAYSPTNSTLTGSAVSVDVYQNRVRIFEGGGNARGVYVDLSKAPNGVGGELLWKASGLVNAGVDVTLGNLKARLANSGNYSLQVSTVSGTYSVYGSSVYSYNGIGGVTLSSPLSITTTPAYLSAGYNFLVAGSTDTWIITDTSAGISWRISLMIGPSFTNNMISIERLV